IDHGETAECGAVAPGPALNQAGSRPFGRRLGRGTCGASNFRSHVHRPCSFHHQSRKLFCGRTDNGGGGSSPRCLTHTHDMLKTMLLGKLRVVVGLLALLLCGWGLLATVQARSRVGNGTTSAIAKTFSVTAGVTPGAADAQLCNPMDIDYQAALNDQLGKGI